MPVITAPAAVVLPTSSAPAPLFTAPAACAIEVVVVNVTTDGSAANGTIQWLDASAGNAVGRLAYQQPAAAGDGFVTARKTLDAGDVVRGYASAANALEASVNVLWSAETV